MTDDATIDRVARDLLALLGTGHQRDDIVVSDMAAASRITARIRALREARGERVVGRKIGFTNATIWKVYTVDGPMWNYMWDTTCEASYEATARVKLSGLAEPRIEPEIVLRLCRAPDPDMDEAALLDCVDQVAHGFEIVESIYPNWRFTGPSSAAAFGLHGRLVIGKWQDIRADRAERGRRLSDFSVPPMQGGFVVYRGRARIVLEGPLSALRHLVSILAGDRSSPPLQPGEIVTTGTLTDAHPVSAGQTWSTELDGIGLPGSSVTFA